VHDVALGSLSKRRSGARKGKLTVRGIFCGNVVAHLVQLLLNPVEDGGLTPPGAG
jgi:hypothetical protein